MSKSVWARFPHADSAYAYAGPALKKNWDRLHRGDREPFPDEAWVKAMGGADPKAAAHTLQEAWRAYHAGEFQKAADTALSLGVLGYTCANKATAIYANYLEPSESRKLDLYQKVSQRCEEQVKAAPEWPNGWYFQAYALGRYGQQISIVKALAQGLGGKVREALDRALKLQPQHADAHIALGTWHSEIIDKVGGMVGGVTYGARKEAALEHFRSALELNPGSAIARIEYANGLVMLYGKAKLDAASRLYEEAAACEAADAMERLDVELAKAELEED